MDRLATVAAAGAQGTATRRQWRAKASVATAASVAATSVGVAVVAAAAAVAWGGAASGMVMCRNQYDLCQVAPSTVVASIYQPMLGIPSVNDTDPGWPFLHLPAGERDPCKQA
mmetsp:Transcript_135241/g.337393  ORF Transcript_135241/g.337393 Transcript_135241/m.337393 type:complete len:113 (+) Transcript_135241:2902-3240(+)